MKKLLILFANGFPYGNQEPFLELEHPLYREYFDKVLIITASKRGEEPTRHMDDPAIEILPDYTLSKDIRSILEALPWLVTDGEFYRELGRLITGGSFSFKKLQHLIAYALCGNHRAIKVSRWLERHPEYGVPVLYSYWLHIPAYGAARLNRKLGNRCYTISRAHGGDLYLERGVEGYHPFHGYLYDTMREIASISENGKQYLESHYGASGKVSVHRLGAKDHGCVNPCTDRSTLRIVSCSRTIPLKRLDRVVDALSQITDFPIHWTHLGDGECQQSLQQYAAQKLPPNVSVTFTGAVSNAKVYEIYKTQPFHVFVNVSRTEGVPVSIMEAMSFGIPAIATDVGGTPELIDEGKNGWLIHKDFADVTLIARLREIMDLPEERYTDLRNTAGRMFRTEYIAEKNYRRFLWHIVENGSASRDRV